MDRARQEAELCADEGLRNRIAPGHRGEDHEVRYWTWALGVTREQLEAADKAVGVSADAVRQHLGN